MEISKQLLGLPNATLKESFVVDEKGNTVGDIGEIKNVGDNKITLYPDIEKGFGFGQAAYLEVAKNNPTKNIVSGDMSPDAQKMWEGLYDKGFATKKELGKFDNGQPIYQYTLKKYNNIISEAYHKAKEDGSNPELVKAVEGIS